MKDAIRKKHKHERLKAAAERGARATLQGIVVSAMLSAVKIVAGVLGHSYALIADGIESMLDILSAVAVLGGLKIASTPPNERYPYGYGKAESLSTLVVSTALFAAALGIAIQSVREIITPHHTPAPFTLVVLVAVIVTKEILYRRLSKAGRSIGSGAIVADAWQHRSDAITSLAAFVGISVALVAGPGYEEADDWAALIACAVICFNGFSLLRSGLRAALDAAPPPELEKAVRDVSLRISGVEGIDKCRVRKSGLVHFVDIHVVVAGDMTVRRGHEIGHQVKDALTESDLGIQDVSVHVEPALERPVTQVSRGA